MFGFKRNLTDVSALTSTTAIVICTTLRCYCYGAVFKLFSQVTVSEVLDVTVTYNKAASKNIVQHTE